MTRQKQLTLQIRSRLALAEKSLGQLSEALELSRTAVSARMNGHRDFTFTELEQVADFLEVPLRDLVDFEAEEGER